MYLPTAAVCFAWGASVSIAAYEMAHRLLLEPGYLHDYDPQTVPEFFLEYGLLSALPTGVWVLGWRLMLIWFRGFGNAGFSGFR